MPRTSIDLNDQLFLLVKRRALDERTTFRDVVERALHAYLSSTDVPPSYAFEWGVDHGRARPADDSSPVDSAQPTPTNLMDVD